MVKQKKLTTIVVAIIMMLAMMCSLGNGIIVANATDYSNGNYISRFTNNSIKSGVILVGDSRTYGMLKNNTAFAGVGNVGARYITRSGWTSKNYIISKFTGYNGSMANLEAQAKEAIKQVGYCHIWFFTTVNDAAWVNAGGNFIGTDGKSTVTGYKNMVDVMLKYVKTAQTWNAKYSGDNKTKYVKVHVVHLIPDKNKKSVSASLTTNINNYEDSQIAAINNKITKGNKILINGYANIVNGTSSYNNTYKKTYSNAKFGYLSDGLHYTDDTSKVICSWIKATSKKY